MPILLYIIAITCYHYAQHRAEQTKYWRVNNIKTNNKKLFYSIIMLRFGKINVVKEEFYGAKKKKKKIGMFMLII